MTFLDFDLCQFNRTVPKLFDCQNNHIDRHAGKGFNTVCHHPFFDRTVDTPFNFDSQQPFLAVVGHFGGNPLLAEDSFNGLQYLVKVR